MENGDHVISPNKACSEELPSLLKNMTCRSVSGFDNVEYNSVLNNESPSSGTPIPGSNPLLDHRTETAESDSVTVPSHHSPLHPNGHHHARSISISMPSSPSQLNMDEAKRVMFFDEASRDEKSNLSSNHCAVGAQKPVQMFYSQPILVGDLESNFASDGKWHDPVNDQQRYWRNDGQRDKRFDSFKTWSGRLERQLSNLRGRPQEPESTPNSDSQNTETEALPVDRYFDALEGPELETLRDSEVPVLPEDKQWPFLLRFPVNSFGICLGVSSQAILWKTLATSPSTTFLHVNLTVNLILWCVSVALLSTVGLIYFLKIIFYFEAVKREYHHPVRVNFFFAPWIACLFLALGVPPSVAVELHASLWYALMTPILLLELKIYGQWMSGGQRRLSKVANPSNHLSIVGNFVGALLGASMGLKEGPIFFFAVGLAHYTVLFVTLYQRLPTNETLPKELHPVFFLFVAAPSVACMAWAKIRGDFDYGSRIAYFIALFLYASLAVRINFFRGFRFSLAWWAYTFPMTGASVATIRYALEVKNPITQMLSVMLSAIATFTVTALLASTIFHAFVMRDLFPNDVSIAISERKQKPSKKQKRHHRLRTASSGAEDVHAPASADALRQQLSV